jgi:hypothetical protein
VVAIKRLDYAEFAFLSVVNPIRPHSFLPFAFKRSADQWLIARGIADFPSRRRICTSVKMTSTGSPDTKTSNAWVAVAAKRCFQGILASQHLASSQGNAGGIARAI